MPVTASSALVGLRSAVGVGSWVAPGLTGRAFGLDVAANPQAPYLARLFGIRDVALAAGVTQSSGDARATWLKIGIACDAFDAAAGALAWRDKSLAPASAAMVTVTALAAVGIGVAALSE